MSEWYYDRDSYQIVDSMMAPKYSDLIEDYLQRVPEYPYYRGNIPVPGKKPEIPPDYINPIPTYLTGAGIATAVGVGNFLTRNYRQKNIGNDYTMPTFVRTGLTNYRKSIKTKPKTVKGAKAKAQKKIAQRRSTAPKKAGKNIQAINKQIKDLRKAVNVDLSTHTYKRTDTPAYAQSLIGRCNHLLVDVNTVSKIETMIANLRFFNPSAPATLVTVDAGSGTYSRDYKITNIHSKLIFRNNYNVPAHVKVYLCKAKKDTATSPLTEYTSALTDSVITASVDETSPLMYITDMERVKENWDISVEFDQVLPSGGQGEVSHNTGEFSYDPSDADTNTNAYQKKNKAFAWVIRLQGVLGHDTTSPNARTLLVSALDYYNTVKAVIKYDAGTQLDDYYITESRSTTGTTLITGVPVIPDNIPYSDS